LKILFDANDSIEAHLLLGLLKQAGIVGTVSGEFLQGAMGELPALGLVKVHVNESDFSTAQEVVANWQNSMLA
jgi:hypothetical protein